MIHDFEKTVQLVDNIDKLLQQHLQEALEEEAKMWDVEKGKSKISVRAKRDFLLEAKKNQLKIIKFSLDKLTEKHQHEIEKEGYLKVKA